MFIKLISAGTLIFIVRKKKTNENASKVSYEEIKKAHIAYHSGMMNRVNLDIAPNNTDTIPADIGVTNHKNKKGNKRLTKV